MKDIYEKILDIYSKDIDEGRTFMYENMPKLMRRNPILRIKNNAYTIDDIYSEAFLFGDKIVTNKNIDDKKKISRLWFLFNKWWWSLYNKLNQYYAEQYNIANLEDDPLWSYDLKNDMLEWVLVTNNIITPLEEKILQYLQQWRGKYEIARMMKTTYYNVKTIIETMALKIERFLDETNEDVNDS